MKPRRALVVGLVLLWAMKAAPAFAQATACTGRKPWVSIGAQLPPAFAETVRSDLEAGLAPAGIEVCLAPVEGAPPPLARVRLWEVDPRGQYGVDVTDAATRKRIGRELQLDRLPVDGRALALAVATEELLRASWTEPRDESARSVPKAPASEVRSTAEPPVTSRHRPFSALGARAAFERFRGGQTHFGMDLYGSFPAGSVVALFLAAGARSSLAVAAPHGAIRATVLSAEAGLSVPLWLRAVADLQLFASGRLLRVAFQPEAAQGAAAYARTGWAMTSRLGLSLAFGRPGSLRSYSTFGAGLPLRTFLASDDGRVVTGVSVLELFASTGLAWELP